MRRELRWLLLAGGCLLAGAFGAQAYATRAAPAYRHAVIWLTRGLPWSVRDIEVSPDPPHPGIFLRLHGEVRPVMPGAGTAATASAADSRVAHLVTRVQVGAAVEAPLIFWMMLLAWPAATARRRAALLLTGIPIYGCLELLTTVSQLLSGFSAGAAALAGHSEANTPLESWSRFLESGGRDVLAVGAALITAALSAALSDAVGAAARGR